MEQVVTSGQLFGAGILVLVGSFIGALITILVSDSSGTDDVVASFAVGIFLNGLVISILAVIWSFALRLQWVG